jgi:hypothetical protein
MKICQEKREELPASYADVKVSFLGYERDVQALAWLQCPPVTFAGMPQV